MSISARITSYLDEQDIKYDTVNHLQTNTAAGTAMTAHIPPNSMAKAVVLGLKGSEPFFRIALPPYFNSQPTLSL